MTAVIETFQINLKAPNVGNTLNAVAKIRWLISGAVTIKIGIGWIEGNKHLFKWMGVEEGYNQTTGTYRWVTTFIPITMDMYTLNNVEISRQHPLYVFITLYSDNGKVLDSKKLPITVNVTGTGMPPVRPKPDPEPEPDINLMYSFKRKIKFTMPDIRGWINKN